MHHTTQQANQAHEESQTVVDKFIASGGKIKKVGIVSRSTKRNTINKKISKKG